MERNVADKLRKLLEHSTPGHPRPSRRSRQLWPVGPRTGMPQGFHYTSSNTPVPAPLGHSRLFRRLGLEGSGTRVWLEILPNPCSIHSCIRYYPLAYFLHSLLYLSIHSRISTWLCEPNFNILTSTDDSAIRSGTCELSNKTISYEIKLESNL